MRTVRVYKKELLDTLQDNLKKHREEYLEAEEEYWTAKIKELEEWREMAMNRKDPPRFSKLSLPQSYEDEYRVAVQMLKASIEDTAELEQEDFRHYWLDEWAWRSAFEHARLANTTYLSSR